MIPDISKVIRETTHYHIKEEEKMCAFMERLAQRTLLPNKNSEKVIPLTANLYEDDVLKIDSLVNISKIWVSRSEFTRHGVRDLFKSFKDMSVEKLVGG
ncbi:unnamed protein product, partial [marine sediment metagenome]